MGLKQTSLGFFIWGFLHIHILLLFPDVIHGFCLNSKSDAKINFVYPPKENKKTMVDGFSEDRYEKENMKDKLRAKVIRNNRLVIEQQGAVIFTQK